MVFESIHHVPRYLVMGKASWSRCVIWALTRRHGCTGCIVSCQSLMDLSTQLSCHRLRYLFKSWFAVSQRPISGIDRCGPQSLNLAIETVTTFEPGRPLCVTLPRWPCLTGGRSGRCLSFIICNLWGNHLVALQWGCFLCKARTTYLCCFVDTCTIPMIGISQILCFMLLYLTLSLRTASQEADFAVWGWAAFGKDTDRWYFCRCPRHQGSGFQTFWRLWCFVDDFHVKSPTLPWIARLEAFANPVPADIKEWDKFGSWGGGVGDVGEGLQSTCWWRLWDLCPSPTKNKVQYIGPI